MGTGLRLAVGLVVVLVGGLIFSLTVSQRIVSNDGAGNLSVEDARLLGRSTVYPVRSLEFQRTEHGCELVMETLDGQRRALSTHRNRGRAGPCRAMEAQFELAQPVLKASHAGRAVVWESALRSMGPVLVLFALAIGLFGDRVTSRFKR